MGPASQFIVYHLDFYIPMTASRKIESRTPLTFGVKSIPTMSESFVLHESAPILSRHQFTKQRIKVLLPLSMLGLIVACGFTIPPQVRPMEVIAFAVLSFVAISAYVPICEIDVLDNGLIVRRILFPTKHVPWSAIDRVLIYRHCNKAGKTIVELTSIGLYEGLSALNRLPGLLYGQGFRQTIVVTPDSVKGYEQLISALSAHCAVFRSQVAS